MTTFGLRFGQEEMGTLSFDRVSPDIMKVYFLPAPSRLKLAKEPEALPERVLLLEFDTTKRAATMYPVNTVPGSDNFLRPKHAPITAIELIGYMNFGDSFELPNNDAELMDFIEGFPSGFTKDPNYGLGLDRRYNFILNAIAQVDGVSKVQLTPDRDLDVALSEDGTTYEIGYRLFEGLRKAAVKYENKARITVRKQKQQSAYSNILTRLDRDRFPVRLVQRRPDDVAQAIGQQIEDKNLSEKDKESVVKLAKAAAQSAYKTQKMELLKLHDEIKLASLDDLVAHIESYLHKKTTEAQWQKLFEANPFILEMTFGFPVVMVQGQAHVGGKKLDGAGEKIADFLFKNHLTDSIAIVEIKTPEMELMNKSAYRSSVYGPSPKLTDAIVQILDQIEKMHSDIHRIRSTQPELNLQAYGIKGVLVAGKIPGTNQNRSFELYRSSLTGVTLVTFDELLIKLKSLRMLLSSP